MVTPCVGVWIEIAMVNAVVLVSGVTPCVGVWIEICICSNGYSSMIGHSLRGSVD